MEHAAYLQIPKGMMAPQNHCLKLQRSTKGLVQSSRVLWLTFAKHLKEHGFQVSKVDQCLFMRKNEDRTYIFMLCIDDEFFLGDKKAIESAVKYVKRSFTITTQGMLKDYLGCNFDIDRKCKTAYVTQPFLINKLI